VKLAVVHSDLGHKGGAESVAAWTAAGLAARGHEVRIFTDRADPDLWPELPRLGGLVEQVDGASGRDRRRRALATGDRLRGRLAEFPLVFAQNRYGMIWARHAPGAIAWMCHEPSRRLHPRTTDAELVAALERSDVDLRHPALLQMQAWLSRLESNPWRRHRAGRLRAEEREWTRRPDLVLANSRYSADAIEASIGRAARVIDLGLPPVTPSTAGGPREGVAVIASASPKKNLHGVLAAAAVLARGHRLPGLVFHVWGVGSDGAAVQAEVARLRLQERVVLHGFLPDPAARARLARARLCLYLPLCEPFGLVAIEALQRGVPLLASDHGGPAEILGRHGGGRTVDPLLPERVADAMEAMLGDSSEEARWQQEARAAGASAAEAHGIEAYLQLVEELLQECARRHAAGR